MPRLELKKTGRPPGERVRFVSRLSESRLKELEESAQEDRRALPDQLDYLLEIGLRVRDGVRPEEKKLMDKRIKQEGE